jgi:dipeptidyl aminopeptidase/acylaminoacyl peptidase
MARDTGRPRSSSPPEPRMKLARLLLLPLALLASPAQAQRVSDTLSFPAGLVADGIPAMPAQLAEDLRRYTEFRSASFADWHPTRREMLISTRFGNAAQIHEVRTPGGARRQLTFYDEPITTAEFDRGDGRYFLFLKDVGGDEFRQIYRYDLATGNVTLISDGGRSQNGSMRWSNRGDRIAFTSTRRNGADRDVFVMNPLDPASTRMVLQVQGGGWSALDWSPGDTLLLVGEYISVNQSFLWLVDVATGARRPLVSRTTNDSTAMDNGRFSADGRYVYATTDQFGEFAELARVDVRSGRVERLTAAIPWDVTSVQLSPDRRTIAFLTNEAGRSRLYLLDTHDNRYTAIDDLPVGIFSSLTWHPALPELALSVQSSSIPGDVYSVNEATRAVTRWTESELGGLSAASLRVPRLVEWRSFDGRTITGWYYPPAERFTGRRPVIVNIHGGPESQARPTFIGRNNYYLDELGVALIYPNVRGSTGFGKTFVRLDNALQREDSVRDIESLFDWIAQQPDLDPSRVLVTGGSYGGYMTLMLATNYSERICCAVSSVGISNLVTFLETTESYRRDLRRAEYGDERDPAIRAWMERTAPVNNAHRITKPLFVIQGANDPRVPRGESEQIVAAARRNQAPVWYLLGLNEGHGFRKKENTDAQFYATVEFVRRFLLGSSDVMTR